MFARKGEVGAVRTVYDKELFSLLVMCYNHEKYIKDAIQSVLAQTYENIEVIICDDCSKDRSWELIQTYLPELRKRFKRVVAFQNFSNMGMILTFNKLIEETAGEIIYCLSGDDMMAPYFVTDVMCASLAYPKASVFVANGYTVDENVEFLSLSHSLLRQVYNDKPNLCKDTLFDRLYGGNFIFAPGVSLRREVYTKFGLYDTDICIEDLEYWLRISRTKETEFVYLDKKVVFYRKNPYSSSSEVRNEQYIERWLKLLEAKEKIIDKYGIYVSPEVYAKRKWQHLLTIRRFYQINIPREEKEIIKKKIYPFIRDNWHLLGWKCFITYYHMYIISLRNK